MEESGVIVQLKGTMALIRAERSSSCDSCAQKKSCHGGSSGTDAFVEAENRVGARVGDHVVFTVSAGSVIKAGLLLYLFPIISFIIGVVLGQTVAARLLPGQNPDLVSGVLGAVFLALAFAGLKIYGSLADRKRSFRPQILRVE